MTGPSQSIPYVNGPGIDQSEPVNLISQIMGGIYSETYATIATGENFEVFCDTFLTLLQRGLMS